MPGGRRAGAGAKGRRMAGPAGARTGETSLRSIADARRQGVCSLSRRQVGLLLGQPSRQAAAGESLGSQPSNLSSHGFHRRAGQLERAGPGLSRQHTLRQADIRQSEGHLPASGQARRLARRRDADSTRKLDNLHGPQRGRHLPTQFHHPAELEWASRISPFRWRRLLLLPLGQRPVCRFQQEFP